jgi:hypothetical protein
MLSEALQRNVKHEARLSNTSYFKMIQAFPLNNKGKRVAKLFGTD